MDRQRLGKVIGVIVDFVVIVGWLVALFTLNYWTKFPRETTEWMFYGGFFCWFFVVHAIIHLSKILEYKIAGHPNPVEAMRGYFRELKFKHEDDPPYGG